MPCLEGAGRVLQETAATGGRFYLNYLNGMANLALAANTRVAGF
jgi:hypothetical protein